MNVDVRVNIINQLRLLRQSTFKDPCTFLDEDVQNAQRAKATQVTINTDWSKKQVIIHNNGEELDNPQKLFSLAESGWDEETQANENPFGMGFFSNISVSNMIEIQSGKFHILFDVETMISTGNTNIQVEPLEEFFPGFQLVLHNFDFNVTSEEQLEERARMLGKFVQDLDVVFNDTLMERKDLTTVDTQSPFAISVTEETCKGWLALSTSFSTGIRIFYRGRFVITLDKYYSEGELHITDAMLTLSAPDRKDVIRDSKYNAFVRLVGEYLEMIATDAALQGSQENQNKYADSIRWYASISKAKNAMKFIVVRCDDTGIRYLRKIISGKGTVQDADMGETARELDPNAVQSESQLEEVVVETEIRNAPKQHEFGGSSYSGGTPLIAESEKQEEPGQQLFSVSRPKFWVDASELHKYEDKVLICKHYDICLVLAQNRFQSQVLSALEADKQVFHLRTLDERILVRVSLTETGLTEREARASMLFDMLSRMVGLNHNAFAIGNLLVSRILTLPEIDVYEEKIESDVVAIHCEEMHKVYVDRSLLRGVELLNHSNPRLALSDYKFILANLTTLVEELSFVTDQTSSRLSEVILQTLGGK